MGNGRTTGVNVGGSSILVIFILLCLTTFATLSMVSAGADLRLTEKTVAASEEYYQADAKAEEILARIDRELPEGREDSRYLEAAFAVLQEGFPTADVQQDGQDSLVVRYSVPINENQELAAVIRVPAQGSERLIREVWRVENVGDWTPKSDGFELWDGGDPEFFLSDGMPPLV